MGKMKYNVLLVDDDNLDQRLTKQALAKSSDRILFNVETAVTLDGALRLISVKRYDVILLDLGLPDSQGLETVKKVRNVNLQLPVIVLTGLADEELGLEAIKEGADDYVVKGNYLEHVLVRIIRYSVRRKEVEDKLRKANEKLKENDELKNEFISMVSHELRTPLSIFKNVISNALAGVMGRISRKLRDNFETMNESINRLTRFIDNFLDISKIESGRMELHRFKLSMSELVCEVVDSFRQLARDKSIELQSIVPESQLIVDADRDKTIQVLTNLIGNAIKFVPVRKGRIIVQVKDLGEEVEVDVEDNGIGIEKEDTEKIFLRFTRIERDSSDGTRGTGLGLPIAKQLVEMQGGRIWVESKPGEGSIFSFVIPKSVEKEKSNHHEEQDSMALEGSL
jgi:signal transduction histidine kinase